MYHKEKRTKDDNKKLERGLLILESMIAEIMCPVCRSYNRHRTYGLFMKENVDMFHKDMKILHFASEKCFYDVADITRYSV